MAFTFYPAVAIFAVLVNMGIGNFYYTQFIVPSIRTQTPQQKNHTLHRKAEELALDNQSQYPTHYNLLLFL
jgi:hypothetical protein